MDNKEEAIDRCFADMLKAGLIPRFYPCRRILESEEQKILDNLLKTEICNIQKKK
tara:strand:+ start:662 stop:826 length:165 start_codon:yes stop_codon:yes gene_type:complete